MAADLPEAILEFFRARPDLQALTSDGALWFLEAPEGTVLPYVEHLRADEPVEERTTGFYLPRATWQFNCHGPTLDVARSIARAFKAAYTNAPLIIQGADVLHVLPGTPQDAKGVGKGPAGQDSYVSIVELDILLARPY